jgi:integrase
MPLNDTSCRNAKPKKKPYKLFDGGGLYLHVQADGTRYWRQKYYFLGKEKLAAHGTYPSVSLADARESRERLKKFLAAGKDPSTVKKEDRRKAIQKQAHTFELVALEWHKKQLNRWSERYGINVLQRFKINVFPYIGSRPIADIDAPELLDMLRKIEQRGSLYVASRMKQECGQVFRYGIATGKCKRDHTPDLKGALEVKETVSYAALDIKEVPELLEALERNDARLYPRTRRAIRLLMLLFTRTNELISAEWDEFDLQNAVWHIPAERMKMGKAHIVPLTLLYS